MGLRNLGVYGFRAGERGFGVLLNGLVPGGISRQGPEPPRGPLIKEYTPRGSLKGSLKGSRRVL